MSCSSRAFRTHSIYIRRCGMFPQLAQLVHRVILDPENSPLVHALKTFTSRPPNPMPFMQNSYVYHSLTTHATPDQLTKLLYTPSPRRRRKMRTPCEILLFLTRNYTPPFVLAYPTISFCPMLLLLWRPRVCASYLRAPLHVQYHVWIIFDGLVGSFSIVDGYKQKSLLGEGKTKPNRSIRSSPVA